MLARLSDCAESCSPNAFCKLVYSLIVLCLTCSHTVSAQSPRRTAASPLAIDPVRPGDQIEVRHFDDWTAGTVISYQDGKATVEYTFAGRPKTDELTIDKLRFPNGEGHWMIWKDASGKVKHEARYIARDQTSVMIRLEDGSDLTLPIDSLALDLRQRVKALPITGEENKVDGAEPVRIGDRVQVRMYSSHWADGIVKRLLIERRKSISNNMVGRRQKHFDSMTYVFLMAKATGGNGAISPALSRSLHGISHERKRTLRLKRKMEQTSPSLSIGYRQV